MIHHDRIDAGPTCAFETRCVWPIRDHYHDSGVEAAAQGRIDQRLQIAPATGNKNSQSAMTISGVHFRAG
jgi:hypothetical protein